MVAHFALRPSASQSSKLSQWTSTQTSKHFRNRPQPAGTCQWAVCNAAGSIATFSLAQSNGSGAAAAQRTGTLQSEQHTLQSEQHSTAAAAGTPGVTCRLLPAAEAQLPFVLVSTRQSCLAKAADVPSCCHAAAGEAHRQRQPALNLTAAQLPEPPLNGAPLSSRQFRTVAVSQGGGATAGAAAGGDGVTRQLLAGGDGLAPRFLVQVCFPSSQCIKRLN